MDLLIQDSGSGADIVLTTSQRDFVIVEGFQNMPYLAMFGGNPRASTTGERQPQEQAMDFWGNSLLANEPDLQFNSETERVLMEQPLTSRGRELILQAVKKDLQFMKSFCEVSAAVAIIGANRVLIGVRLKEPANLTQQEHVYIWDAVKTEVTETAANEYNLNFVSI
jgi:hypothetical protein